MKLQDEVAGTENRIATSRKDYNDAIAGLQHDARSIPDSDFSQVVWL